MPTFSGPIRSKNPTGTSGDADVGNVVLTKEVAWTYEDTALTIETPAGSNILDIAVDVEVAVANVTTALMDVGTSGTADLYAADVDMETLGRTLASGTAAKLVNLGAVSDGTILIAMGGTGYDSANAGSGRVIVTYVQAG